MFTLGVVVALAIAASALALTPRSSTIQGSLLLVHTRTMTFRFDLRKALSAEPVTPDRFNRWTTLRLFGVGWPLQPFGWFRNRELGTFLSLVNDSCNMWMVRFPGRSLLVSPANGGSELTRVVPSA